MSSRDEPRQQKIPFGSYRREEVVNPCGTVVAPSTSPARPEEQSRLRETELMEQIVSRGNMTDALSQVVRNKGAAGIDGMEIRELKPFLRENWERVRSELLKGVYKPEPVRRVEIPKPAGGARLLGIPTVLDRLIQQALHQALTPIFDPEFSDSSYGFRKGRSARGAMLKAREHVKEGYRHVVDMDLAKFFDRVNHDMLMARVARKVTDKRVLRLIRSYLEAGVMAGGLFERPKEGTPQGGPLSPLLANIVITSINKDLGVVQEALVILKELVLLKAFQKLLNGTKRQQYKIMLRPNIIWVYCIMWGKVFLKTFPNLKNGSDLLPNKGMLEAS